MFKTFFLACTLQICVRGADTPTFDVVSIRPHDPDDARFLVRPPSNGRFVATGTVAKFVLMLAYDVQETQITGGPNWLATEKWDIEAKSNEVAKSDERVGHSVEETRHMLQNMLKERFALQTHRETQQRPVYVLTIAKGGAKFKAKQQVGPNNVQVTSNSIHLDSAPLARMTQILATALGRPVIDQTGLGALYDLSLQGDDAPVLEGGVPGQGTAGAIGSDHGSIFTAIQDQLGLRLDPQRAPVEVMVVDRMERPSPN